MDGNLPNLTFVCSGTIYPSRFVSVDPSDDYQGYQSPSGGRVIGVSQTGSRLPPTAANAGNTYAGTTGDLIGVYGVGKTCYLKLGTTVAAGDALKPDASGQGINGVSAGNYYGAVALQQGVSGDLIRVSVLVGTY